MSAGTAMFNFWQHCDVLNIILSRDNLPVGLSPTGGETLFKSRRCFIAQSPVILI